MSLIRHKTSQFIGFESITFFVSVLYLPITDYWTADLKVVGSAGLTSSFGVATRARIVRVGVGEVLGALRAILTRSRVSGESPVSGERDVRDGSLPGNERRSTRRNESLC